ncbi:Transmembrane protein 53-B [Varanus komodoensis]|nr:Transmembrane protein 53-B [Varanus komodoensis]
MHIAEKCIGIHQGINNLWSAEDRANVISLIAPNTECCHYSTEHRGTEAGKGKRQILIKKIRDVETRQVKKADRKKVDEFETWCWISFVNTLDQRKDEQVGPRQAELALEAKMMKARLIGEDDASAEKGNNVNLPVVILLGWAGCKDRHLEKYSAIYLRKEFKESYLTLLLFFLSILSSQQQPHENSATDSTALTLALGPA